MDIILYLLQLIQQLYQQNCFLINFICKYIPLKQWAFDDSHSPKYQKFMHRAFISTKTMVQKVSLCVKYAVPSSHRKKAAIPH